MNLARPENELRKSEPSDWPKGERETTGKARRERDQNGIVS